MISLNEKIVTVSALLTILSMTWMMIVNNFQKEHQLVLYQLPKQTTTKNFRILAWNPFYKWKDYGLADNGGFHACEVSNCVMTPDSKQLDHVDAIFMHGPAITHKVSENFTKLRQISRDAKGWPLLVYFNKESPV